MSRPREFAKFLCGAEAFHALVHTYFWTSGTTLTVFGITQTPTLKVLGVAVNAIVALALGIYSWGPHARRTA